MVRIFAQILLGLAVAGGAFVLATGLHMRARILDADASYIQQALFPTQEAALRAITPLHDRCSWALSRTLSLGEFQGYLVNALMFWAAYPIVCHGTPEDLIDRAYFANTYLRGWGKPGMVYDRIAPRVMSDLSDAEFGCLMQSARSSRTACRPDQPTNAPSP